MLNFLALTPLLAKLGLPPAIGSDELAGGALPHWRLGLEDGTALVLRAYRDGEDLPRHEAWVAGRLAGLSVPTKQYLCFDESRELLPFAFALTSWVPGRAIRAFADAPDAADLHRQMGALLREMHEIRAEGFGLLGPQAPKGPAHFDAFLDRHVPAIFAGFRKAGGDPALADALERHVAAHREVLWRPTGAVLAHNDFQPGNVLADRGADGKLRLTGLIDFGSAVGNDATSDLAKALFCCEHEMPGCGAALRAGYGPVDHPEPEAALRLNLLLHRLIMWTTLSRVAPPDSPGPTQLITDLEQMLAEPA